MIIKCKNCHKKFKVQDSDIPNKGRKWADQRKQWVIEGTRGMEDVDYNEKTMTISSYVNDELRLSKFEEQ